MKITTKLNGPAGVTKISAFLRVRGKNGRVSEESFIGEGTNTKQSLVMFFDKLLRCVIANRRKIDKGYYIQFFNQDNIPITWYLIGDESNYMQHDVAFHQVLLTIFHNDTEVQYYGNRSIILGMERRTSKDKILNYRRMLNFVKNY
jgi:hypothetical protein